MITKTEADLIIEKNPKCFTSKTDIINDTEVIQYNYLIKANYTSFFNPIPDSQITAVEMRGITFVRKSDGK